MDVRKPVRDSRVGDAGFRRRNGVLDLAWHYHYPIPPAHSLNCYVLMLRRATPQKLSILVLGWG